MAVLTLVTGSTLAPRPAPAAGLPATVVLGWSPGVTRDVPLSGPLTVYFNRVMDPTSVERAWRLSPAVAGTFSASENAVTFTPATPLRPGSSYRLTVDGSARGSDGLPLASPFSVAFSTGDALRVLSHAPWNGTTGVPANGLIAVTFNHPMVGLAGLGSGTPGTPRVPAGWSVSIRPGLAGNGSWLGTSTWVFHPSNGLEPSTWYTVSLGGSARDASGEPLGRGLRWSFRTVTPEVFSRSPSRGESFADPRRPIRVTFNQPMDRAATDAAFSLSTGGAAVPGSISWQGTTLVFRPGATLAATGPYTVAIGPSARSANGAATLGRRVRWQFRAAPPPAVTATDPGQGGTAYDDGYGAYTNTYGPGVVSYPGLRPPYDYGVTIDFDTPMSKLSLDRHLAIEPAVARFDTTFGSGPDDSLFAYGVYGDFKPSTQYTVTIKAKARDQFGRPLPSSYTLRFRTSRLHPSVALYGMPSEEGISFSAGRVIDAPVQLVNVPRVTYTLVRTTLQALASVSCCSGALTPPYGTRVRTWTEQIPHPLNRVQNQGVHLAQKDGSPLAAGLYWLGASAPGSVPGLPPNSPAPASWEIVAVTNTGLTLKTGSNGTLVWATSAQSGQPASGLRVRLVDYQGNIVATGTTNGNGLHFFRGYVSNQGPLSAVVDDHVHFGIVRGYWSPDLSPAGDFPHFWWWPAGPSSNGTYLYTDRPVYRPGQRVHFRALLWRDRDGVYGLYGQKTVVISASDATGRPLYRAQVSLDRFGAVHGSFDLPGTTPTGSDYLSVYMPNRQQGGVQVSASFLVAEYRKPEFLTTVTPARPSYVQRQTATATVGVEYVFGVPVANQQVSWVAYAWPQLPSPPGWDAYTFADWEDFWNQTDLSQGSSQAQSQLGVQVAQGTGRTDARGRLTIRLPVDLAKQKFDRTLTIEATTTDINHQSVSGRAQLAEYRSGLAIGLSAEHQVIPAGQQAAIDVVAVKQDGTPVPNAPLTATIYNRTYTSRLVNNGSGQSSWQAVPHDTPVETRSLSSDAGGKATLTFTPKDGGEYRVVVEGKDELGNATSTAISISASAAGFSDWGLSSDISLALKPDKTTYRVGDTAHILVPAPFDHATALITLERGTIRKYWVQHLVTNSSTVDVPITLDDLPNVYVGVALYRGWRDDVPGEGKGASPPDWRYGSADLHVSVDPRHLIVHLQQSGSRHHPGDPVTYVVTTTDQRGRSVSAQVSLALVDTAVLALQDESNPDILAALYSDRPLGVSTASDGVLSVDHLQTAPSFPIQPVNPVRLPVPAASVPKPGGGGGGPAIPPAVTVRSRFADTAYWSGGIVTDRSGRGVVHLTLPDNATTWRLDVRGLTADQRVGQAQLRTLATQDLVLRPVLPRFLLEGDRLQLGTVLNNNLRRPVSVRVSLAARGLSILSRPDSALTVPARGERLLFWRVSVPVGSRARLTFRALPSTSGVRGDAVLLTLPVHPPLTDETVAASGQVYGGSRQMVVVPRNAVPQPGALTVQVAASLTAGLGAAYGDFRPDPYESNGDVADRVLAAAGLRSLPFSITGLTSSTYSRLPLVIAAGAQKLLDHQFPDGGWPWFNAPLETSDPGITGDVVQALSAARRYRTGIGWQIQLAVQHARIYLRGQLGSVDPAERARLLLALAQSGPAPRRAAESLYGDSVVRSHLAPGPLAALGTALGLGHDAVKRRTVVSLLDSRAMVSATGAHWETDVWDPWSGSVIEATTQVLANLVRLSPHDPFVPAAVRWLMLARQGSGWDCPHDTAEAIAALAAYARAAREGTADYQYRVMVDGATRLAGRYSRLNQRSAPRVSVPVRQLRRSGPSALVIDREPRDGTFGLGPLYYVARLQYYLPADAIAPRDEGVAVSRRYLTLQGQPISAAAAGTAVQVELTIHTDQTLLYLNVQDPLPVGFEPIDSSLNTSQQGLFKVPNWQPPGAVQDLTWYLDHADLRDDRASLYAYFLPPGTYRYTYLAQATVPGRYGVPPTHVAETFFPEVFGRGAGQVFTVR